MIDIQYISDQKSVSEYDLFNGSGENKQVLNDISKRKLGEAFFTEQEISLPENKSLFVGMMKVEMPALYIFLDKLTSSRFVFGILMERTKERRQSNHEILASFYEEAVFIEKEKHIRINWLRGINLLCGDSNIIFRLASDGQDNQYPAQHELNQPSTAQKQNPHRRKMGGRQ